MTVESINSTITVVVASELGVNNASAYAPTIAKVSEALTQREYDIADHLLSLATNDLGLGEDETRGYLESAGLAVRPVVVPEPEEEEPVTADDVASAKPSKSERIAKLEEGQSQILEAIKGLTALAKRHLGADL